MAQDAFGNETPPTSTEPQTSTPAASISTGTAFDDFQEQPPKDTAAPALATPEGENAFDSAPVVTSNDHGVLSFLKDQTESATHALGGMLFGKGTTGGEVTNSEQWKDINPLHKDQNDNRSYWQRQKDDFSKMLNTSAIVLGNAIPDEQIATNQHPHEVAAIKGASDAIQGLTTPATIAMIIGTEGIGELPAAVEKAFAGSEALSPYAANAAKVAARSLQALGVYFTGEQIAQTMSAVPEIAKAALSGQTDKAIELTTQALINGAVAYHAGKATVKGIRGYNTEQAASSAMAHEDYNNLVHDRAAQLVTAGGQKDQIADLGVKAAPKEADREWTSEYVEANRDRAEMAKHQAETKNGPTPAAQIESKGGIVPISEAEKTPRYVYRGMKESEQGVPGAKYDQASSSLQEAQSYAKDRAAQTGEPHRTVRIDLNKLPKDSYEISGGMNTPDLVRFTKPVPENALETLDEHGNPSVPASKPQQTGDITAEQASDAGKTNVNTGDISEKPPAKLPRNLAGSKPRFGYGQNNFQLDFDSDTDKALYTIAQKTKNAAHNRFVDYLKTQFPGVSEDDLVKMGQQVRINIKGLVKDADPEEPVKIPHQAIAPPKIAPQNELGATHVYNPETKKIEPLPTDQTAGTGPKLTYTTDSNGITYAEDPNFKSPEGNPVKVAIPARFTGADRDVEANRLLNLQKDFFASRSAANGGGGTATAEKPVTQVEGFNVDTGAGAAPKKGVYTPSAQEALALQSAVRDAQAAAAKHVITPEERARMVTQQDPTKQITSAHEKAISFVMDKIRKIGLEAQKRGLLKANQVRDTYVPHEYNFDDTSDPLRRRLFDTYHEAQQAGHVPKNKDYFALASDYVGKMWNRIADQDTIKKLYAGRTNDGSPLAVSGGFVEGQRVSGEGPQSRILNDTEVKKYAKNGQLPELIRSGRVEYNPEAKTYTLKADDYKKADNLYELRPIGPTPIPPNIVDSMKTSGTLDQLVEKGLIFQNKDGDYVSTQPLWARVPVYLHPDIAEHFNNVVKPTTSEPTSAFGRAGKFYDDLTGNMKSLLLSWSPFHRVTESMRMMEAMGVTKGGKLAAQTNLKLADPIDYFNLTPSQASAIRDGIVTSDPRGKSMSNVEEGLGAGEGNTWGNRTYRIFDRLLEKAHVPESIRSKINLQNILTKDVFGPQGMITQAKFKMYDAYKPQIMDQMRADHPDWSPQEIDKQAGRLAAEFANNKFGGLNQVLLGRTLKDQKLLRRLLLAPDFLESTGRSILDVGDKYGSGLAAKLIQFNVAHALTAAGINYALHHDPDDKRLKSRIDATHLLDHPFEVIGPDNKTAYGLRTTMTDFLHMTNRPREFSYDRINPLIRAGEEIGTQRNAYGRKEPIGEAMLSVPKAALPIQIQNAVGLGSSATTEPSAGQQFMKSVGIQARPNRTPAEQKAIDLMSAKLSGTEALTGSNLVRQQMKFNAEDKLRTALQAKSDDADKKKSVEDAKQNIDMLVARKLITPQERKNILIDARGSRLKSSFIHMDPTDALTVWNLANDQEKEDLGPAMQAHFIRWRERLAQQGEHIGSLSDPYQKIYDGFKTASQQLSQIRKADQTQREIQAQKEQIETGTAFDDFKPEAK